MRSKPTRTVGSDSVVVPALVLGDNLSFLERLKDHAVQSLIFEFAAKALAVTIFTDATRPALIY